MRENTEISDNQYGLYVELLKENLAHARHIEMERLTFMSLFLVSIGIIAEYSQERGLVLSLILGICTLAANMICTALLFRWDSVYVGHMDIAKKIAKALDTGDFSTLTANGQGDFDVNNFYNFNNRALKRAPKPAKSKTPQPIYIKTAQYFLIFNGVTYVMIFAFLINTLLAAYTVRQTLVISSVCLAAVLAVIHVCRVYNQSARRIQSRTGGNNTYK